MDERTSGWCDKGGVGFRDLASIIAHFTEQQIDEMRAAIDERVRLARDVDARSSRRSSRTIHPTTWKKNPRKVISSILHNLARMGGGEFPTPPPA
jgi:hypothetical protein